MSLKSTVWNAAAEAAGAGEAGAWFAVVATRPRPHEWQGFQYCFSLVETICE